VDLDDLILISIDDHLVEPPTLFDAHIPETYRDQAPKVIRTSEGDDVWVYNDTVIPNIGLNAVAGKPRSEFGVEPTAFEEIRPGCYDVHERVKDMSAAGVLGSMNFPSFPSFSGRLFANTPDKGLALSVLQAYNDWHIDEWCGTYPDRFIPMAITPLWDIDLCVAEVRRTAAKGCHSITFTENPAALGFASFHEGYWDPLWEVCSELDVVVSIHLGSSGQLVVPAANAPVDVMITLQPMNICQAAADLLWSNIPRQFPGLKIALTEGGIGWIPYFLERCDRTYEYHHEWTGQNFGGRLPSEVFRDHFLTCFINDPVGVELRHKIGIDNICWEMDYPHSDASWPVPGEDLLDMAARCPGGVPDDEIEKMAWRNALRWYSWDPFAHRSKESSTVNALRAEVPGHDVSEHSYDQGRRERHIGANLADLAAGATA
jgi:predicted TIM-barrel fold metal-dependent hydrolase